MAPGQGREPRAVQIFRGRLDDEVEAAVQAAGAVGLAVLLLGGLFAWRLADRVVAPVTALTQTARAITETDLSRRIQVQGRDEVAQLATTFNAMLDRLERAFGRPAALRRRRRPRAPHAAHDRPRAHRAPRRGSRVARARRSSSSPTSSTGWRASSTTSSCWRSTSSRTSSSSRPSIVGQLTDELEQKVQGAGRPALDGRSARARRDRRRPTATHAGRGPARRERRRATAATASRSTLGSERRRRRREASGCATAGRGSRPTQQRADLRALPARRTAAAGPRGPGSASRSSAPSSRLTTGASSSRASSARGSTFTLVVPGRPAERGRTRS